jgi:DNA-binding NtrC family response regulator
LDATITGTAEIAIPSAREAGDEPCFVLVLHSGDGTEVVRLSKDCPVVVGRDFPAHVQIDDPKVSRQHVRFLLHEAAVRVEDLDSRNGTRVNGVRISGATLAPGDEVQLGSARIGLAKSHPPVVSTSVDGPDAVVLHDARVIALYEVAKMAAPTDVPVLVLGETGTGKEHLARTIHGASLRADQPWHAINCSAIPANLIESTLFGHERGAFTGADKRSAGLFEAAAGGTVFLDEVAELPLSAQAVLLRVLENRTFQRVGSTQELTTDARIVAATNCDLEAAIAEGTFRRDLLYRINTVTLELPPLRERIAELEPLIACFLAECRRQWGVRVEGVEPDAFERMRDYPWPGNIRQLRSAIERAALVAPLRRVRVADLPPYLRQHENARVAASQPESSTATQSAVSPSDLAASDSGLKPALRDYETRMIQQALARTGGNRLAAAKLLRIPRRTLYRRMQALGLAAAGESRLGDLEVEPE